MSTTIFIKLKPVMETEKQLCFQLAELNGSTRDTDYQSKREKIEKGIAKCRDTISVMEVKLKKVLDKVKQAQSSRSPNKKRRSQVAKDMNASTSSRRNEEVAQSAVLEESKGDILESLDFQNSAILIDK